MVVLRMDDKAHFAMSKVVNSERLQQQGDYNSMCFDSSGSLIRREDLAPTVLSTLIGLLLIAQPPPHTEYPLTHLKDSKLRYVHYCEPDKYEDTGPPPNLRNSDRHDDALPGGAPVGGSYGHSHVQSDISPNIEEIPDPAGSTLSSPVDGSLCSVSCRTVAEAFADPLPQLSELVEEPYSRLYGPILPGDIPLPIQFNTWKHTHDHFLSLRICWEETEALSSKDPHHVDGIVGARISDGRLWIVHEGYLVIRNATSLPPATDTMSPPAYERENTPPTPSSSMTSNSSDLVTPSSPKRMKGSRPYDRIEKASLDGYVDIEMISNSPPSITRIPVVFKFCRPSLHPPDADSDTLQGNELDAKSAEWSICNEADLYSGPLACIQGKAVPTFHGLFHDASGLSVMVLERTGPPIGDELHRLHPSDKCVESRYTVIDES